MLITPAFAQGTSVFGGDILSNLLPIVLMFVIFYFLLFRPQQQRMKKHKEMLTNLRRGDSIVTSGGLIGKITKVVDEREIELEIAPNTRVRVLRSMISDVNAKTEPVKEGA